MVLQNSLCFTVFHPSAKVPFCSICSSPQLINNAYLLFIHSTCIHKYKYLLTTSLLIRTSWFWRIVLVITLPLRIKASVYRRLYAASEIVWGKIFLLNLIFKFNSIFLKIMRWTKCLIRSFRIIFGWLRIKHFCLHPIPLSSTSKHRRDLLSCFPVLATFLLSLMM